MRVRTQKKELIDAFFEIDKNFHDCFTLGFIGDQKQRIYTDGKENIETLIPCSWETPIKQINYRCAKRIVELSNKIGILVDENAIQKPLDKAIEGIVRLFLVLDNENLNKSDIESQIAQSMCDITQDEEWALNKNAVKILALEHMMAAKRLGFAEFFAIMRDEEKYGQSLLQGLVDDMDIFTKISFPLLDALKDKDTQAVLNILKSHSPLLNSLPSEHAFNQFDKCKEVIHEFSSLNLEKTSICDFLRFIEENQLFKLPNILKEALISNNKVDGNIISNSPLNSWIKVIPFPIIQIKRFDDYTKRKTMFDTHQGVKGLEFDRVMVILDDNESKGFLFSYNKLLGVEPLSDTDKKNQTIGKESTIERTIRLLYVTCTRAKKSLAIVMYTTNTDAAKYTAIKNGWFDEEEIIVLS